MVHDSLKRVVLVLHDIRSAHNVGSMFRTADGAGVSEVILSGYTPIPPRNDALYLTDADKAMKKTALGAEQTMPWRKVISIKRLVTHLRKEGYEIVALEQSKKSIDIRSYQLVKNVALFVGNEVGGVDEDILKCCDVILEIPMRGQKNSLNVSVATGIALYQIIGTMKR